MQDLMFGAMVFGALVTMKGMIKLVLWLDKRREDTTNDITWQVHGYINY